MLVCCMYVQNEITNFAGKVNATVQAAAQMLYAAAQMSTESKTAAQLSILDRILQVLRSLYVLCTHPCIPPNTERGEQQQCAHVD